MADQELIAKIMTEVTDLELRDKLLNAVVEKKPINDSEKNILIGLGLKPDAIQKTVKLNLTMNKIGCGIFFIGGLIGAFFSPIGILFMVFSVMIYFINNKYYGNLVK